MSDREKVISTFEKTISVCKEDGCDFVDLTFENAEQILALLKEQKSLINFLNHQREKGHWIFGDSNGHSWMKCSQCLVSQDGQTACFSFCPNCGASMEEEPEHMT